MAKRVSSEVERIRGLVKRPELEETVKKIL